MVGEGVVCNCSPSTQGLPHGVCPPSFWLPTGPQLVGFLPGSGPGVRFWIGGGGEGVPELRSLRLEVVGFGSGVVHTQVSCSSRCVNLGYAGGSLLPAQLVIPSSS